MQDYSCFLEDENATETFGRSLVAAIQGVNSASLTTLYLGGDLGAGKTTLTRGVMRGVGYQGAVKSPTYTLVEPYEMDTVRVYHFDLYRLADAQEMEYLGVDDYFQGDAICLIEWPERGVPFIPVADMYLNLNEHSHNSVRGRTLNCKALSQHGKDILNTL